LTARSKLATPLQNNPDSQQSIPLHRNRIQRLGLKPQTFVNGRLLSSQPPGFQILIDGNKPVGGQWNFDQENRHPPKGKLDTPKPLWFEPDAITQEVIAQVKSLSFLTYGNIEPFRWAVTREQALQVLDNFIEQCLPAFGFYQDAMVTGEETMWHSLLSPYLNIGLLHPLEVIQAAETAYLEKNLNLNGVEGFTRQIMGWREYIRGMYFYVDADYFEKNWFNHTQPLPEFFLGRQ
jgi:deoxyribodipyrimidine photolyase-related protein